MEMATPICDRLMEAEQRTLRSSPNLQALVKNLLQHRLFNVTPSRGAIGAFPPKGFLPTIILLLWSYSLKLHEGASPSMVTSHCSKPARLRLTASVNSTPLK